jgi:hypothetical protein
MNHWKLPMELDCSDELLEMLLVAVEQRQRGDA